MILHCSMTWDVLANQSLHTFTLLEKSCMWFFGSACCWKSKSNILFSTEYKGKEKRCQINIVDWVNTALIHVQVHRQFCMWFLGVFGSPDTYIWILVSNSCFMFYICMLCINTTCYILYMHFIYNLYMPFI